MTRIYIFIILIAIPFLGLGQTSGTGYWSDYGDGSFSLMDLSDASKTPLGTTSASLSAGDFGPNNILYAIHSSSNGFYEIDTASGATTLLGTNPPPVNHLWTGLAFDETTGVMYGVSSYSVATGESSIYEINVSDGSYTLIGSQGTATAIACIAIDHTGQMYGLNLSADAKIYEIDKTDGQVTVVGSIGQGAAGMGHAMDYNSETQTMYLSTYNSFTFQSTLRIVDLTNGSTTEVGDVGTWTGIFAVSPPPLSADFSASDTMVCAGSSVTFTDMSGGATSWSWVFEGGTPPTSTDQNPTITYSTPGTYDVELTASNAGGSDYIIKTDYIMAVILPEQADEPVGDTSVCSGTSNTYTTNAVPDAGTYEWEVDPSDAGSISGSGTTATFITDYDWTGDFTIRVRAVNACGDGQWSDDLEGNCVDSPQIFDLSEGGAICEGGDGIEITQDGSQEGNEYELFLDGESTGTIVTGTGGEISFGVFTDEGNYTATGSNGACFDYMAGTAIITYQDIPDAGEQPIGDTAVCSGSTVDYTCTAIESADTIVWTLSPAEAGNIIGSGEEISVEWSTDFEGAATLSIHGENECGLGEESEDLEIEVSGAPSPEITGEDVVCKQEEADYFTDDNSGSTYEWTVDGGEIVMGEGTYQITVKWGAPGMGSVSVTETIEAGCPGTSEDFEVTIEDCVGVGENSSENLNVYPNPAKNILNIKSGHDILSVRLYDLAGKEAIQQISPDKQVQLDVSGLKAGIYLIVVETNDNTINQKIVIE